jgi:AraC-like DNA-binding protein
VRVANLVEQRKKLSVHYRKEIESDQENFKEDLLSMDEKFLRKARTMVEKNLSNPEYGVDTFAADMALSRVQLHRKLRALVNQSVTEFIRNLRLNRAIELLNKRIGNISEVAYDAGFNNPTYFGISFKKRFGISPSEYLDQLNQS